MKKNYFLILIVFLFGCNNDDFSPRGELDDNIAVYFILDNSKPVQFMKYQHLYFTENGTNTADPAVQTPITVFLSGIGASFTNVIMKDTVIAGINNYNLKYAPAFIPSRGGKYSIHIIRQGKPDISSSIIMTPSLNIKITDNAEVGVRNFYTSTSRDPKLIFTYKSVANISYPAKASIFKMFLMYEVNKDGVVIKDMMEVPVGTTSDGGYIYPTLRDSGTTKSYVSLRSTFTYLTDNSRVNSFEETVNINQTLFMYALKSIGRKYQTFNVKVEKGFVVYKTYDDNMKLYLSSLSTGSDSYSVRLDELNWSNLLLRDTENIGLFSAITNDTMYFDVYSELPKICGYGLLKDPYYEVPE